MKISNEEIKQMSKMFEWADTQDQIQSISIVFIPNVKALKAGSKAPECKFKMESLEWTGERWLSIRGYGNTILDSMKKYSIDRVEKEGK